MLSIVIPTKNEENYLPKLLRSINSQEFKCKYKNGMLRKKILLDIRKIQEIGLVKYSYMVTKLTLYRMINKVYHKGG